MLDVQDGAQGKSKRGCQFPLGPSFPDTPVAPFLRIVAIGISVLPHDGLTRAGWMMG